MGLSRGMRLRLHLPQGFVTSSGNSLCHNSAPPPMIAAPILTSTITTTPVYSNNHPHIKIIFSYPLVPSF